MRGRVSAVQPAALRASDEAPRRFLLGCGILSALLYALFAGPSVAGLAILQPLSMRGHFTWNFLLGVALWGVVAVIWTVSRGELSRRPVTPAVAHG